MHDKSKDDQTKKEKEEDKRINTADEDSFPASDPPPWTVDRTGDPKRNGEKKE